ncbi:hypothetical protein Tco_0644815 [Tanacetum coccineum]
MFYDNSAAFHFANKPGVQKGARHYHRRYYYVHESIALGEIRFLKVHTDDNMDDPFPNALPKGKLTQHARSMGLRTRRKDPSDEKLRGCDLIGMKRGFLSQKGSGVRRGVKGKQVLMADKSVEAHGIHSHVSANEENMHDASTINNVAKNCTTVGPNPAGNTQGMSISYANVIGVPSKKALNFHTLFTPTGNGVDVEECPKNIEVGMAKVLKKPTQAPRGVLVGPKKDSYENADFDYDPYDDDLYEGPTIPNNIQTIYDNFDIKVRGRNGKSTSMWYDNWCELGPLFRFISNRSLYSARFSKDMVVADMVSNGDWKWPSE